MHRSRRQCGVGNVRGLFPITVAVVGVVGVTVSPTLNSFWWIDAAPNAVKLALGVLLLHVMANQLEMQHALSVLAFHQYLDDSLVVKGAHIQRVNANQVHSGTNLLVHQGLGCICNVQPNAFLSRSYVQAQWPRWQRNCHGRYLDSVVRPEKEVTKGAAEELAQHALQEDIGRNFGRDEETSATDGGCTYDVVIHFLGSVHAEAVELFKEHLDLLRIEVRFPRQLIEASENQAISVRPDRRYIPHG